MNRDEFEKRARQQRDRGPMTSMQRITNGTYRIGKVLEPAVLHDLARELLPCPLDGGEAEYGQWNGGITNGGRTLWIACTKCGLNLPALQTERWRQGYGTFFADDDAIAVLSTEWNHRHVA